MKCCHLFQAQDGFGLVQSKSLYTRFLGKTEASFGLVSAYSLGKLLIEEKIIELNKLQRIERRSELTQLTITSDLYLHQIEYNDERKDEEKSKRVFSYPLHSSYK